MPNWITMRSDADRQRVQGWVSKAPPGTSIAFKRPNKRTRDQNDLLWPWLRAIAVNVPWADKLRSPEDWKDLFTAALRGYEIVPSLDGDGVVHLGLHTSELTKSEMADLLDYIVAFASERGVFLEPEHHD